MRDLEELAQRCVPGRGAVRLERVGGGLLNETYRAERAGCVHALRVAAPQAPEGFAPRGWGCRVAHRAAAAGLAPAVEHCDPDEGILVCRWIPGHAWSAADARVPANVIRFAALLRQVHALAPPSPAHRVSPALWIARYTGLSGGADAPAAKRLCRLAEPALRRLDLLAALPPGAAVLCHGDLHPRNLVDGENGLVLLDWEYAHVADPCWDLAVWCASGSLDERQRDTLLTCYLGRAPAPAECHRLDLVGWLYEYTCLLWSEVHALRRPDLPPPIPAAHGDRIMRRLAAHPLAAVVAAGQLRHTTRPGGECP